MSLIVHYSLAEFVFLKEGSCSTMAIIAARAGAQQVFDIEYLSLKITSDPTHSFEPGGFQHFHGLWPMVTLRCEVCFVARGNIVYGSKSIYT